MQMQYQERKEGKIENRKNWWKNVWMLIMIASVCVCFIACSTTELEQRCFPMLVAVGYEDGKVTYGAAFSKEDTTKNNFLTAETAFGESKSKYEKRLNKDADYNHLKILVLESELLENPTAYGAMLDYLAETEDFPRNTYVCAAEDVDDLFELEKNISQDLGTYLEEYLKQQEDKKERLLTLGDLLDERVNQTFVLYMPYFEVEENFVEWKGYMNTTGKSWQESN